MKTDSYMDFIKLTGIFPVHGVCIVTSRDKFTLKHTKETLYNMLCDFSTMEELSARKLFGLCEDSRDWQIQSAQQDVIASGVDRDKIVPILYRPFDIRFTYYTGKSRGFLCMPRYNIMKNMLMPNLGLITVRQTTTGSFDHCFVSETLVESRLSSNNKGICFLFPLYLYPNISLKKDKGGLINRNNKHYFRQLNIKPDILERFNQKSRSHPGVLPEQVFYYTYAVLFSNVFRERYLKYLESDFPRIPITASYQLFVELGRMGEKLLWIHLMKSWGLNQVFSHFMGNGRPLVNHIKYVPGAGGSKPKSGRVYINNTRFFTGIPREIWEYKLCGYPVMKKWLSHRKGCILSEKDILHYTRIARALQLTITYQEQVDRLYLQVEENAKLSV